MKKIIILLIICLGITGCSTIKDDKLSIVTTNFPSYDFTRAIIKDSDSINLEMIIKPGEELHDYEPTPQDIIKIKKSDIFIYVGGDSDSWIEEVLKSIDTKHTKVIKLMDLVKNVYEGSTLEGDSDELDEHVWTSPNNAKLIVKKISDVIIDIDIDNKELYENNTINYIDEIEGIITSIKDVINNSKRNELIFGDRFPLIYFTNEFNLDYYAAFPGCSHQTEASSKTIAKLIDKVKKDKIPVVLKLELSNNNIAQTIADATNTKVLEFHSIHNVTKKDFEAGVTYIDLMQRNIKVLKEALM